MQASDNKSYNKGEMKGTEKGSRRVNYSGRKRPLRMKTQSNI